MYSVIKDFQSLLVGVVGFVGVIATLLVNSGLARRQHTRQVEHDATVLRLALRAELETIRDVLRDWLETFDAPDGGKGFFTPLDSVTDVYERTLGQLGLLKEHEIRAVMYAYLPIRQLPEVLKLLEQSHLSSTERARGGASKEGSYGQNLKRLHESALEGVEKALSVIIV